MIFGGLRDEAEILQIEPSPSAEYITNSLLDGATFVHHIKRNLELIYYVTFFHF